MADIIDARVLARRQKDLDGFTEAYERLLEARKQKYAAQLGPVWERAGQRIDRELKNLLKDLSDGQGRLSEAKLHSMNTQINRLQLLQQEIARVLSDIEPQQVKTLTNQLAYEYARSYYHHAFGTEVNGQVRVNVPLLTSNQVMGVLANPWLPDGLTYSDRIRTNTAFLAQKMYQAVGKAVAEGWDVNRTARTIQDTAQEGYYNAVRLARTEITRAAGQGASHLYMQNADVLDGKRWNAVLDSRTAPKDANNDGKIYDLDYDTPENPGKPGERIPNHPHCRCIWSPVLSALGPNDGERIARQDDGPTSYGQRTYTKARTYREYAKERGLPDLDDRLANDDTRPYLRRGETVADFGKPVGRVYREPTIPKPIPLKLSTQTTAPIAPSVFTPARTTKEAEDWAKVNLGVGTVDYSKTTVEVANQVNRVFSELSAKYGINGKLDGIVPMTKGYKLRGKSLKRDTLKRTFFEVSYAQDAKTGSLLPGRTLFTYSDVNAASIQAVEATLANLKRQGLMQEVNLHEALTHEFGHYLDAVRSGRWVSPSSKLWDEITAHFGEDHSRVRSFQNNLGHTVGDYMNTNNAEFFAEVFRVYEAGRLPAELSFVEGFMRGLK